MLKKNWLEKNIGKEISIYSARWNEQSNGILQSYDRRTATLEYKWEGKLLIGIFSRDEYVPVGK
jgi:hypothetical protein